LKQLELELLFHGILTSKSFAEGVPPTGRGRQRVHTWKIGIGGGKATAGALNVR
jgi:hypothetical protein